MVLIALAATAGVVALASSAPGATSPRERWLRFRHVPAVLDLSAPRRDGRVVVAAAGRLLLLGPGGTTRPFARGRGGYRTARGREPYIARAAGARVPGAGCAFRRDDIYALEPRGRQGIIRIDARGRGRRLSTLPGSALLTGIAFDGVGRFGHRLLVTSTGREATSVFALDCRGRVQKITATAPRVEGGIVVAPRSFGAFAGQLIAPDERTGVVYAIDAHGIARTVVRSGLPSGGDIGVESEGFVPAGLGRRAAAYVADRRAPGNAHPGTDSILALSGVALARAGVRGGDLLVAGEGGTQTIAVRCRATCTTRHVADGPRVAHTEGHIVFLAR